MSSFPPPPRTLTKRIILNNIGADRAKHFLSANNIFSDFEENALPLLLVMNKLDSGF